VRFADLIRANCDAICLAFMRHYKAKGRFASGPLIGFGP
jgi:hypothetical protein